LQSGIDYQLFMVEQFTIFYKNIPHNTQIYPVLHTKHPLLTPYQG
jgi:hypothetical protein